MQILEISFRDVEKTEAIENLIRRKAVKLKHVCKDLIGCRAVVERPQQYQRAGNPYRVRIYMTVPGNDFVATGESSIEDRYDPLPRVVRHAFIKAHRKLRGYADRQRSTVIPSKK